LLKLREYIKNNILFKITSLNALVISIRLIISLIILRALALLVGESGIAKIGQLRNLIEILGSTSTLGIFNGIVKYVSEHSENKKVLQNLFSTTFVFIFFGSIISSILAFFSASWISETLFGNENTTDVIKVLALILPIVSINRIFKGIINGLSDYKRFAKIDLFSYILSAVFLLICLFNFNLKGVLYAIVLTPLIQLIVVIYVFASVLKKYIKANEISFRVPFANQLLAFTLMSFVSTVILNYIELDIRTMITNKIDVNEAGYWTAMTFISKNYMVFSSGLFTLYVIPKFSRIYDGKIFRNEIFYIYKTLLPIFGVGMLLVYLFRETVIEIVYPNFLGLEPLFKWQLLGDFIRLGTLVISHQFLAKKMVKSFIITELISLGLFYILSKSLVGVYGAEGVVMAHFYRYIIYFIVVVFAVWYYFKSLKKEEISD